MASFNLGVVNAAWAALNAAAIPTEEIAVAAGGSLVARYAASATQGQRSQGDSILAGYDASPRVPRTLFAIRADLVALSGAQKANVWTALIAGSPPLWATDAGPNAAALAALQMFGASASLSAADVLEAKTRAAAFYVQDNPTWLVHPSFDSSINIDGSAPAP